MNQSDKIYAEDSSQIRDKKILRKNRILGLILFIFALTMIILTYLMFKRYEFVPYK